MTTVSRLAAALTASALAGNAPAHHGVASYRMGAVESLAGTVVRWTLDNPHAWLTLDVHGATWEIEGAPPRWMTAQGFTAGSYAVGDAVTVTFHPHRTTPQAGILMEVRSADGSVRKVNRPASLGGP
jgi:hypothetical protein